MLQRILEKEEVSSHNPDVTAEGHYRFRTFDHVEGISVKLYVIQINYEGEFLVIYG